MREGHHSTAKALLRLVIDGKPPFDILRSWERNVIASALQKDMRTIEYDERTNVCDACGQLYHPPGGQPEATHGQHCPVTS